MHQILSEFATIVRIYFSVSGIIVRNLLYGDTNSFIAIPFNQTLYSGLSDNRWGFNLQEDHDTPYPIPKILIPTVSCH